MTMGRGSGAGSSRFSFTAAAQVFTDDEEVKDVEGENQSM